MIFVPQLYNNYTIEREHVEGIGRNYRVVLDTGESHLFPSMTTILSSVEDPIITQWKKNVGEDVAYAVSKGATDAGTLLHEYCEYVMLKDLDKALALYNSTKNYRAKLFMKKITPYLKKAKKVYASEQFMFSLDDRIAGTVDAIVEYEGKLVVLDFKTSKQPKFAEDIESYFVQVAGYAALWKFLTGEVITDTMILLVNPVNVQEIPCNVKGKYTDEFRRLVAAFYDQHGRRYD